jgi:hypothetical protein
MDERVYRVSTERTVGMAVALLLPAFALFAQRTERGVPGLIVGFVLAAAFWVFWATGLEYRITTSEINRRSRFGARTLRWEQLSELRYRGEKRSHYLIPLGTYVTLWLRDAVGQKLTISGGGNFFGYLVACTTGVKELQDEVLRLSREPLLRLLKSRFDAGEDLQLGPVSLSRASGLKLRTFLGTQQIPLADLAAFGVHEGSVYFYRRSATKSERGIPVRSVPNCFALLSFLESLGVQPVPMQAGFVRPRAGG